MIYIDKKLSSFTDDEEGLKNAAQEIRRRYSRGEYSPRSVEEVEPYAILVYSDRTDREYLVSPDGTIE